MALGKFKSPGTAAKAPPKKAASRYAGVSASAPRDPMPHVGEYRFRVVACDEGHNPGKGRDSFKAKLEIVELDKRAAENHAVGDVVVMLQFVSGNGAQAGLGRVKSFIMAAGGFETEEEYDAFDPDGLFIEACTGAANEYSERGETVVGRLVDCKVTRGNDCKDKDGVPTGDYYRDFAWAIVPEEEQA